MSGEVCWSFSWGLRARATRRAGRCPTRRSWMARKLKSDKVLFIATILLVALSIVMVYSASAPMALERYGRASRFLITQAMWSVLGIAMLSVVMRIDYRFYREPTF